MTRHRPGQAGTSPMSSGIYGRNFRRHFHLGPQDPREQASREAGAMVIPEAVAEARGWVAAAISEAAQRLS